MSKENSVSRLLSVICYAILLNFIIYVYCKQYLLLGIIFAVWFMIIPMGFIEQNFRLAIIRGDYKKALLSIKVTRIFFPKSMLPMNHLLQALLLADSDQLDKAEPLIRIHFDSSYPEVCQLAILKYGLFYGFDSLLPWFDEKTSLEHYPLSKEYFSVYARTLVETGQIQKLITLFPAWDEQWTALYQDVLSKNICVLLIFAYTGKKEQTELLAQLVFSGFKPQLNLWEAVAAISQGEYDSAKQMLLALQSNSPKYMKKIIHNRLSDCNVCKPIIEFNESERVILQSLSGKYSITNLECRVIRPGKIKKVSKLLGIAYLIIVAFLVFCVIYSRLYPRSSYPSNTHISKESSQIVHWAFNSHEIEFINAALVGKEKVHTGFYTISRPVKGFSYTIREESWPFTYQGKKYLAFHSDNYSKVITMDKRGFTNVQAYELYKSNGTLVYSIQEASWENKRLQVLVQLDNNNVLAHTFVWDTKHDKPVERLQKFSHLQYSYVENPRYSLNEKWNSLPLNKKMTFMYFSNDTLSLKSYDLEIKPRQLKTMKKELGDRHFLMSSEGKPIEESWFNPKNLTISKLFLGAITLVSSPKEVYLADRFKPETEAAVNTSGSDLWLVDRRHLEQLKIKLRLKEEAERFLFSKTPRQAVEIDSKKPFDVTLTLQQHVNPNQKDPALYPNELNEALKPTLDYQSDDSLIQKTAQDIVQGEKQPSRQAVLLAKWVNANIRWTYAVLSGDARQTLKNRIGDCSEHAALFVALARALHIPTREVHGYLINSSDIGAHAWNEIYDHGWKEIDPSSGEWVGTNYIRMEHTIIPNHILKFQTLAVTYHGKTEIVNHYKPYWYVGHDHYYNRMLGLVVKIPSYLSFNVEKLYKHWLFMSDGNVHYPMLQRDVEHELFSLKLKPSFNSMHDLLSNYMLFNSTVYLCIQDHDSRLYDDFRTLASNAVFDGARFKESWQEKHDGLRFAVSKYQFADGEHGLFYTIPLNHRMDLAFSVYGSFAEQKGHPAIPPAMIELVHTIRIVEPDIIGKRSKADVSAILRGRG